MEYGLYRDNQTRMRQDIARRNYDFILGSVHFVDDIDVYFAPYWQGKTVYQAQRRYFEEMLDCVQANDDFDVLAHMTYLHKGKGSPVKTPLAYADHSQIIDEILRTLAAKGKGLELNTSGVDRCGGYLPTADYFRRGSRFSTGKWTDGAAPLLCIFAKAQLQDFDRENRHISDNQFVHFQRTVRPLWADGFYRCTNLAFWLTIAAEFDILYLRNLSD